MKHSFIRRLLAALCLALVLGLAAPAALPQGVAPIATAQAAAKVKLNMRRATIFNGQTLRLKLSGTKDKVTWSSSDRKVARVNSKGKVSAKKAGTAVITAKVGRKSYKCKVTVKPALAVKKKSLTVRAGKSATLDLWYYINGTFTWDIADESIVTCTCDGQWYDDNNRTVLTFTGLKAGTTTVKITNDKTKDTVKLKIRVKGQASMLAANATKMTLREGQTGSITFTVMDGGEVTCSIGNANVVDCAWGDWEDYDLPLYFTGVKAGSATVTVTHTATGQSIAIPVTVTAK